VINLLAEWEIITNNKLKTSGFTIDNTIRDREVGGSNPLAPTNPKVKRRNKMRDGSGNPRMVE
jgi:hypothetical protein